MRELLCYLVKFTRQFLSVYTFKVNNSIRYKNSCSYIAAFTHFTGIRRCTYAIYSSESITFFIYKRLNGKSIAKIYIVTLSQHPSKPQSPMPRGRNSYIKCSTEIKPARNIILQDSVRRARRRCIYLPRSIIDRSRSYLWRNEGARGPLRAEDHFRKTLDSVFISQSLPIKI